VFRTVPLSIIKRFSLYTQQCICHTDLLTACEQQAVSKSVWHIPSLCVQWKTHDDGQRNCPKHAEFYSKNNFEKLVHLVGFILRIYHDAPSPERQKCWKFQESVTKNKERNKHWIPQKAACPLVAPLWRLFCALSAPIQTSHKPNVQDGPKVGIQYIVNYRTPTFGPSCIKQTSINWHTALV